MTAVFSRITAAFIVLLVSIGSVWAAEPEAAKSQSTPWDNIGSVALGLLAVLAVILFSAWLMRRLQGLQGPSSNAVRTLAVLSVGQRERIALLEVGKTQLLVGITAHSIRTLHVFDEPVMDSATASSGDFASRLQAMLAKGINNHGRGAKQRGDPE